MKKAFIGLLVGASVVLCASCLTMNEKKIIDPPWRPAQVDAAEAELAKPPIGQVAPVYFSKSDVPSIDGDFAEWEGLEGVHTRVMVYGGLLNRVNTDGAFVLRTDGTTLYLFADIIDDDPGTNQLPAAQAWRGDSIEFFFGTDTSRHTFYKATDKRMRIIPKSKTAKGSFDVALNDVSVKSDELKAAVVYSDAGYKIEAAIPVSLLGINPLKNKQRVRCEFQINDADNGKERSRLVHWMSDKDASYMNAGTWGDGKVVPLPSSAGGEK